jgi:hypothetical protein
LRQHRGATLHSQFGGGFPLAGASKGNKSRFHRPVRDKKAPANDAVALIY